MTAIQDTKRFQFGNHTDIGRVRAANEDYLGYFETVNGHIFVVCDGMGGHVGGATASQLAVDSIRQFFEHATYNQPQEALKQSILYANQQILAHASQNPHLRGMGTTCVVLLLRDGEVFYAHVGDSRIYLLSNRRFLHLTKDHSVVQEMVDQGIISEEEAESHPRKNELTRALGTFQHVEVDVCERPLYPNNGDIFLLCTDGLTGMLSDIVIQQVLSENKSVQHKAIQLVEMANEAGGIDNITVQIIQFNTNVANIPVEDMVKNKKTVTLKKGPDYALILLGILFSIVLILLYVGLTSMSDERLQESELTAGQVDMAYADEETIETTHADANAEGADNSGAPVKNTASTSAPVKPATASKKTANPATTNGEAIITHTVSTGETFSSIARRYNLTNQTLEALNPAVTNDGADIKANATKLKVKVKALHKVGPGDVLAVVSKKYGVDKQLIMAANGKTTDNAKRGETLIIPFSEKK